MFLDRLARLRLAHDARSIFPVPQRPDALRAMSGANRPRLGPGTGLGPITGARVGGGRQPRGRGAVVRVCGACNAMLNGPATFRIGRTAHGGAPRREESPIRQRAPRKHPLPAPLRARLNVRIQTNTSASIRRVPSRVDFRGPAETDHFRGSRPSWRCGEGREEAGRPRATNGTPRAPVRPRARAGRRQRRRRPAPPLAAPPARAAAVRARRPRSPACRRPGAIGGRAPGPRPLLPAAAPRTTHRPPARCTSPEAGTGFGRAPAGGLLRDAAALRLLLLRGVAGAAGEAQGRSFRQRSYTPDGPGRPDAPGRARPTGPTSRPGAGRWHGAAAGPRRAPSGA
jgi:hypothetical protein